MYRRTFLKNVSAMAALPMASVHASVATNPLSYKLKTSCNLFSFNKLMTEGTWTLEQVIDYCGELGFDAIDPTGYYFSGYPTPPSKEVLFAAKRRAFGHGMAISGTGLRNDFALPSSSARKEQIALTKQWVEVAAALDAPVLRVFAGKELPIGYAKEDVFGWIIEALQECVEYGEKHGVIITLQNHFDALRSLKEVQFVLEQINSPWFGLNLDIGSLRLADPYEEIKQLLPYASTWQIKEDVYVRNVKEKTNIDKLFRIIKEGGYKGYLPLETLPPSDPRERLSPFLNEVKAAMT